MQTEALYIPLNKKFKTNLLVIHKEHKSETSSHSKHDIMQ